MIRSKMIAWNAHVMLPNGTSFVGKSAPPATRSHHPPPSDFAADNDNVVVVEDSAGREDAGQEIPAVPNNRDDFWRAKVDVPFYAIEHKHQPIRGVDVETVRALHASIREMGYREAHCIVNVMGISDGNSAQAMPAAKEFQLTSDMRIVVVDGRHCFIDSSG